MHWCHGPVTVPIFVGMRLTDTVHAQDRMVLSQCQVRGVVNVLLICPVQMFSFRRVREIARSDR
jgi:hypothetical protein